MFFEELRNRRNNGRHPVNLQIEFYGDDLQPRRAQTINLSTSGARILTRDLPQGEHFQVKIDLDGHAFSALADSVWSEPSGSHGGTVVGLRFASMNRINHLMLNRFCAAQAV